MKLKLLMTIGITLNSYPLLTMEKKISVDSLRKSFEQASLYLSTLGEKTDDILSMSPDDLCAFRRKLKYAEKEQFQFGGDLKTLYNMAALWKNNRKRYRTRLFSVSVLFHARLKEYGKMSTKPESSGKLEFGIRQTLLSLELLEKGRVQFEKINSIVARIPTPKI